MEQLKEIHFHGHHYQVGIVKRMLEEEIALYEKRIVVLKRATLKGQDDLIETYQNMIAVRVNILSRLNKMIHH